MVPEGVNIGPLINAKGVQKVQEHVEDALNHGARIAFQLESDDALVNDGDNFFKPTILADVTPSMRCSYEETFGPIAPLIRFSTESEVIELANDTSGLAAYFYTKIWDELSCNGSTRIWNGRCNREYFVY